MPIAWVENSSPACTWLRLICPVRKILDSDCQLSARNCLSSLNYMGIESPLLGPIFIIFDQKHVRVKRANVDSLDFSEAFSILLDL